MAGRSFVEEKFDVWRATIARRPEAQPELAHNLSVFSYKHQRLTYTRLGHVEYTDADGQRLGARCASSGAAQQPESEGYYQVKRFYPPSITRTFKQMHEVVEEHRFERPVATRVEFGGLRYSLRASPWLCPRLGQLMVFTANTTPQHTSNWHRDFFLRWQRGEVTPPPARFRGDALWVMDARNKTVDELVEQHERGTPAGVRPCSHLLRRVLTTDALESAEIRIGGTGLPYQMSVDRVAPLDLIVIQRTQLSRLADPA